MSDTQYLTPKEAAVLAKRAEETVTLALRNGELKGYQRVKKGRWTTTAAAVNEWILGVPMAVAA